MGEKTISKNQVIDKLKELQDNDFSSKYYLALEDAINAEIGLRDGRIKVLPCKIGDVLYRAKCDGTVDEYSIVRIGYTIFEHEESFEIMGVRKSDGDIYYFTNCDYYKTIFHEKRFAEEKALELKELEKEVE